MIDIMVNGQLVTHGKPDQSGKLSGPEAVRVKEVVWRRIMELGYTSGEVKIKKSAGCIDFIAPAHKED